MTAEVNQMDVKDNLMYLCVVAVIIAAALFAWFAYDSSSMKFIWAIISYQYTE